MNMQYPSDFVYWKAETVFEREQASNAIQMNPAFEHLILTDEIGEDILLRFLIHEHFYVMYVVYAVMCTCVVYAINLHTIILT